MLGQDELQEIALNIKNARQNAREGNYVHAMTYYEIALNTLARTGNKVSDPEQGELIKAIRETIHTEVEGVKKIENILTIFKTKPRPKKSSFDSSEESYDNGQDGQYDMYGNKHSRQIRRISAPKSVETRGDYGRYKPPAPRPIIRNTSSSNGLVSSNNNNSNNLLNGAGGIGNRIRGIMGGDIGRKPTSPQTNSIDSRRNYEKPWLNSNKTPMGNDRAKGYNSPSGVQRPGNMERNSGGRLAGRRSSGNGQDSNDIPVIKGCSSEDVARIWNNILENPSDLTLDDLAGIDSVKEILNFTFIMPTMHPNLFKQIKGIKTILLFGPPGTGKCLGPDVLVKTKNLETGEIKNIKAKDIKVGNILLGDDYRNRYVVSTIIGYSEMYKISERGNLQHSYTCNGEHLLVLWISSRIKDISVSFDEDNNDIVVFNSEKLEKEKITESLEGGITDGDIITIKASNLYKLLNNYPVMFSYIRGITSQLVEKDSYKYETYPLDIESIGLGQYYGFTLAHKMEEHGSCEEKLVMSSENGKPCDDGVYPGRFLLSDGTVTHNTTIAKAVSNVCQMRFLNITSSTLTSKFHGGSENLAKTLFAVANYLGKCVIFFDEIDGVLTARGGANENEASLRVKTEILMCMQGINSVENKDIFIIGATNCPWAIDPAALRRFDKKILIPLPDRAGRIDLFKHFTKNMNIEPELRTEKTLETLADMTEGWSGADIKQACDDSIRDAMMDFIKSKTPQEIEEAENNGTTINVSLAQMIAAVKKHAPTATGEMVKRNDEWNKANGSSIK